MLLHSAPALAASTRSNRQRRARSSCSCSSGSAGGDEPAPSSFSEKDLAGLSARVSQLRAEEVATDMRISGNWRHGRAKTGLSRLPDWARRVALSEQYAVAGSYGGNVHVLDATSGFPLVRTLSGLSGETTTLSFDGVTVAAGSRTGEVCRWDVETGAGGLVGRLEGAVSAVALLPGGTVLACSDGGVVQAFTGGDEPQQPPLLLGKPVGSLAVSGRYTAVGCGDGTVEIFASSSPGTPPLQILSFKAHSAPVLALAILNGSVGDDPSCLFTAGGDGAIRAWSLATGEALLRIEGAHRAAVTCLAVDHSKVVSGGRDGAVRVWDAVSGARRFTMSPFTAYLDGLAFHNNVLVTTGVNDAISVSDFATERPGSRAGE